MKLYCPSDNHKLQQILFAGKIFGKSITHIEVPFNHKNKQFLDVYPNCTLPALELENGKFIFGEHTILRFIAPKCDDPMEITQINQWFEFIQKDLQPSTGVLVLIQRGYEEFKQQQKNKALQAQSKFLKILDETLKLRTFIVGNRMSIVDISVYHNLKAIQQFLIKQGKWKGISNVNRWFKHIKSIVL